MSRRKEIEVTDGAAPQAQLNRRDLVLKALAVGGGAAAAAALAPSVALAADGDTVHVGQMATTGSGNPTFWGENTGTGAGVAVNAAGATGVVSHSDGGDGLEGVSTAPHKSGLYAEVPDLIEP